MAEDEKQRPMSVTIPGLDVPELQRVLGQIVRDEKALEARFDDYVRQTHGGIDQQARDGLAALTVSVALINSRLTTAEQTLANIPGIYATITHDHAALYSVLAHTHAYADITSKPSTFTPATHAHSWTGPDITNKQNTYPPDGHSASVHDSSVPTESEVAAMRSTYNNHYHSHLNYGKSYTFTAPDGPLTEYGDASTYSTGYASTPM